MVEVLENAETMAEVVRSSGFEVVVDGVRLVVGPGDDSIEAAVVSAAAETGSGLVRMIRGSASLEDLFMNREAAS
jgi:hypothetical protein